MPEIIKKQNTLLHFLFIEVQLLLILVQLDGVFKLLGFDFQNIEDVGLKLYTTTLNAVMYMIAIAYVFRNSTFLLKNKSVKYLSWILLYFLCSILWVKDNKQQGAIVSYINLLGSIFQALAVCCFCNNRHINLWGRVIRSLAMVALLFWTYLIFFPNRGVDEIIDNRYRGFFSSPNNLGQICGILVVVSMSSFIKNEPLNKRCTKLLILITGLFFLYMCQSMTVVIGLVISLMVLRVKSFYKPFYVAGLFASVFIIILFSANQFGSIGVRNTSSNQQLGRDATLTGRTGIWDLAIQQVNKKNNLLVGFGFDGFWDITNTAPSSIITDVFSDRIQQAHNGLIELYIQTGILGMTILVLFLLQFRHKRNEFIEPGINNIIRTILLFVVLNNLTEASFFQSKHALNSFFFISIFYSVIVEARIKSGQTTALAETALS